MTNHMDITITPTFITYIYILKYNGLLRRFIKKNMSFLYLVNALMLLWIKNDQKIFLCSG